MAVKIANTLETLPRLLRSGFLEVDVNRSKIGTVLDWHGPRSARSNSGPKLVLNGMKELTECRISVGYGHTIALEQVHAWVDSA